MSSSPTSLLPPEKAAKPKRGSVFWLSFTAVVVCNFLSALDITAVSTALPTITNDLNGGDEFVWVGSAYGLAAAAILPLTGRLADIMGRRPIMMTCVGFFFLGSALSGSAQNMHWLIAARSESPFRCVRGRVLRRAQRCRVSAVAESSTWHPS